VSKLLDLMLQARDVIAATLPSELMQIPDGDPFQPGPQGISMTVGGTPKAGESAGYQTLNTAFAGNWSSGIGAWRVQHMVWAHNPEFTRVSALLASIDAELRRMTTPETGCEAAE